MIEWFFLTYIWFMLWMMYGMHKKNHKRVSSLEADLGKLEENFLNLLKRLSGAPHKFVIIEGNKKDK